jgi:hypothetical protein
MRWSDESVMMPADSTGAAHCNDRRISARPTGSLGKMLHHLEAEAEGATPAFLLRCMSPFVARTGSSSRRQRRSGSGAERNRASGDDAELMRARAPRLLDSGRAAGDLRS